jgi:hypothetical protein
VIDLRQRSTEPELMDVQATDLATVQACLRDLERINRWTGAYRITLRWLERVLDRHRPGRPLVARATATCCAGSPLSLSATASRST